MAEEYRVIEFDPNQPPAALEAIFQAEGDNDYILRAIIDATKFKDFSMAIFTKTV